MHYSKWKSFAVHNRTYVGFRYTHSAYLSYFETLHSVWQPRVSTGNRVDHMECICVASDYYFPPVAAVCPQVNVGNVEKSGSWVVGIEPHPAPRTHPWVEVLKTRQFFASALRWFPPAKSPKVLPAHGGLKNKIISTQPLGKKAFPPPPPHCLASRP